jgi:hypothetical protein
MLILLIFPSVSLGGLLDAVKNFGARKPAAGFCFARNIRQRAKQKPAEDEPGWAVEVSMLLQGIHTPG